MEAKLLRELILIRHGQSVGNVSEVGCDNLTDEQDPVLTDTGLNQAQKLGEYFSNTGICLDAVYTSGLRRTVQTASQILKYQENKQALIIPDLCEIGINPAYGGQTLEALKAFYPAVSLADGLSCESLVVPDETPWDDEYRYFERAQRVLDYLGARYNSEEQVALVSHAGFLTYIIFLIIGYKDKQPIYDFRLSNTGVTRILFYEPGTNKYGDIVFDCVNERNHLC